MSRIIVTTPTKFRNLATTPVWRNSSLLSHFQRNRVLSRSFSTSKGHFEKHVHSDARNHQNHHHKHSEACNHEEHHHVHSEACNHEHHGETHTHTGARIPIAQIQPTLAIIYTCMRCETRSAQQFARVSYEKGTVIVRCPGCQVLHLIADNMGIFTDERSNVFDYLREKGHEVEAAIRAPEELERLLEKEGVEIGRALGMYPKEDASRVEEPTEASAADEEPNVTTTQKQDQKELV